MVNSFDLCPAIITGANPETKNQIWARLSEMLWASEPDNVKARMFDVVNELTEENKHDLSAFYFVLDRFQQVELKAYFFKKEDH